MKEFLEIFYFIFSIKEESYNTWIEDNGLMTGFVIMFFTSVLISLIYYFFLGNKYIQYATLSRWWCFQLINSTLVFVLSTLLIGLYVFPNVDSVLSIPGEVIIFSLLNSTIYSGIFFLIFSLIFNNFSINPRYIPFNIFKKS